MKKIKLVLADDHDIVRAGIKSFLEQQADMVVVAEARDGQGAINAVREKNPDLILMDISMKEMGGLEATRQIKEFSPECRILVLTVHADKQHFFELIAAGAEGYVTKQAAADDLIEAIRAVAAGHVYLQPALARWLLDDYRRLSDPTHIGKAQGVVDDGLDILSPRERQVLELVADGHNNNQIGDLLGISPKTVARHRERIMGKLDLHSCAELVKFAVRTGLIDVHK